MCFGALPIDPDFEASATVNAARNELARIFGAALPTFTHIEDRIEFPSTLLGAPSDHWKNFKAHFARIQHGRCGYCELPVIGSQFGDVEHYRPKGKVEILDPDRQGRERADLSNVENRRAVRSIGTGYWWHAYSWNNYLLCCAICNQGWKKNYFPIDGDYATRSRPMRNVNERELLLYPFGTKDPVDHFEFEIDGRIRGRTPEGVATIETVGLWRPSLVVKRRPVLQALKRVMDEMSSVDDNALLRIHARRILDQGSAEWPMFPGMTRIFFTQITGLRWIQLEAMVT